MIEIKKYGEDYVDTLRMPYTEIFVNPTPREFRDVYEASPDASIRFLATTKPKEAVYIFSSECLHLTVGRHLGLPGSGTLTGNCVRQGRFWNFDNSSLLEFYFGNNEIALTNEILKRDWSWVNDYIQVDEKLREYRERFIELKKSMNGQLSH